MRAYLLTMAQILKRAPALKQCPFCGRILISGPSGELLFCDPCSELAGWFPQRLSYTLVGDAGTGKSSWLYLLLDYYLHFASPHARCVFVAFDDFPAGVRRHAAPFVKELEAEEKEDNIVFVDGYSAMAGSKSAERHAVADSADMEAFSDMLAGFAREGYGAFFLDSLTPLATLTNPSVLAHGLVKCIARLKSEGATTFLTTAPTLAEGGAAHLRYFTDALLEFRQSESLKIRSLASLGLAGWLRGPKARFPENYPLREFRFRKARGRSVYPGWIPFVIAKETIFIALPDNPLEIRKIHEEIERLEKMAGM